jgi:hypothetical protein
MKTAIWCYFPISAGISPHGRYQPHGQWRHQEVDATGRDRVYGWFSVDYHVSGVSRPGRVGHPDPQRPSTGSIWRPISRQLGEWHFVRWIGPLEWIWNYLFEGRCAWRCLSHITKRSKATGLVIAPPVWELTDFYPQNTPKSTTTAICRRQ